MKTVILISALCLTTSVVKAQNQTSDKIYWIALEKYTYALTSTYSRELSYGDQKIIFLEKPSCVDSIPPSMNGYAIILITSLNRRKLYLEHGRELIHTQIFPVRVEGDHLSVTVTPYRGKMTSKKHYNLAVSDGTTVYFKYDCDKKEFVFDKIENWGI